MQRSICAEKSVYQERLGRELINIAFEAPKWQRAVSKMGAGDSYSTGKAILFSDRSHFGVLRI